MHDPTTISHDEAMKNILRKNSEFAIEYFRAAIEEDDPGILLSIMRRIADARGGLEEVAEAAGIDCAELYATLSSSDNDRAKSLLASLKLRAFKGALASIVA